MQVKITSIATLALSAWAAVAANAAAPRQFIYSSDETLLAETTSGSNGQSRIDQEYVWFGDLPVAQFDDGSVRWTFADHLGTPVLQTGSSANVVWRVEAEPFGAQIPRIGATLRQPLRASGQEADDASAERFYNVERWYRPQWGSYTQADPIGIGGGGVLLFGDPAGPAYLSSAGPWNVREELYGYAADDPLSFTDRFGLAAAAASTSTPASSGPSEAFVCCDGNGGFKVCWNAWPENNNIKGCMEAHEKDHADWLGKNPGKCKDQCKGRPKEFNEWQMTRSDWDAMECRGYALEASCIRQFIMGNPHSQEYRHRISDLINKSKKHKCNTKGWMPK